MRQLLHSLPCSPGRSPDPRVELTLCVCRLALCCSRERACNGLALRAYAILGAAKGADRVGHAVPTLKGRLVGVGSMASFIAHCCTQGNLCSLERWEELIAMRALWPERMNMMA